MKFHNFGVKFLKIIKHNDGLLNECLNKYKFHEKLYSDIRFSAISIKKAIESTADPPARGLVLGVYADERSQFKNGQLTTLGFKYNKFKTNENLMNLLKISGSIPKNGQVRVFFSVETEKIPYYSAVAIVGLGKQCLGYCSHELIDEQKEQIRKSIAQGCMELQRLQTDRIEIDPCGDAESAAEGAALGIWIYQELRNPRLRIDIPTIDLYTCRNEPCDLEGWNIGLQKAGAQNLTRQLQETPANILTPTALAQNVVEILCKSGVNVEVKVDGWAQSQGMNAFLAVGQASSEAPIFLELSYYGTCTEEQPIVLIGQGTTHDTGGICLKNREHMLNLRGDMTGAACVIAAMRTIAGMRLPINIRGLIPLCENMIGCNAFKPGDCVKIMNGKTIEIQRTDMEDLLILADTLLYAQNFCPKFIVDIGNITIHMTEVLDDAACAVFTNSEELWHQILNASMHTADRVWRFPLWNYYKSSIKKNKNMQSDMQNHGTIGSSERPCAAAALLNEFVPCGKWLHIDTANVMFTDGDDCNYIRKGMAGRPTRTLIEFLAQTVCYKIPTTN